MLADGTAYRPFQYRVLVPWLAATLRRMSGADLMTIYRGLETAFSALIPLAFFLWLRAHFPRRWVHRRS